MDVQTAALGAIIELGQHWDLKNIAHGGFQLLYGWDGGGFGLIDGP